MSQVRQDVEQLIKRYYCAPINEGSIDQVSEPDVYSPDCIYIAAYVENLIAGTIRLNLGPTSRVSHLLPQREISSAEVSRLVICRSVISAGSIQKALILEVCKLALEYHHELLVTMISLSLLETVSKTGFCLEKLYDLPIFEAGLLRYPVAWRPDEVLDFSDGQADTAVTLKRLYPSKRKLSLESTAWA